MALDSTSAAARRLQAEREVQMRVTVLDPPPGVALCLRSKDDDLVGRMISTGDDISFDFHHTGDARGR